MEEVRHQGAEQDKPEIFGLPEKEYDKSASQYSAVVIVIWLIVGLLYNLLTGKLFSWSSLLLILPGTLLVSLGSIPFFWLNTKKTKIISAMDRKARILRYANIKPDHKEDLPYMILFTVTSIAEWVYPVLAAVAFVYVTRHI